MSDGLTAAGVTAGFGAVIWAPLAYLGINPVFIAGGLIGCVIVQNLLPSEKDDKRTFRQLLMFTLASVLLAGIATPLVASHVHDMFAKVPERATDLLSAALVGGFAQPMLTIIRAFVVKRAAKVVEGSDA